MSKNALPAIRFALREYRLCINKAALMSLGKPAYLQFLYQNKRKLLAIVGSIEKKEDSYNSSFPQGLSAVNSHAAMSNGILLV